VHTKVNTKKILSRFFSLPRKLANLYIECSEGSGLAHANFGPDVLTIFGTDVPA